MAAAGRLSDGWAVCRDPVGEGDKRYAVIKTRREVPELLEGQVLLRVQHAALNRRDHWIRLGLYPGISFGSVLGADCCGVVEAVGGGDANSELVGREVVVDSCMMWGEEEDAPTPMFHILGMAPADGTLQQYLVVDAAHVYPKPAHLTSAQAAALPLAGLTAYRATSTKGGVKRGSNVLVTGIGGGVALFALQFAVAAGAHVWVTSSSDDKIRRAVKLGAAGGVNYKTGNLKRDLRAAVPEGFDVVVDGAGGDGMDAYIAVLRRGGVISQYGATAGRPRKLNVTRMFLNQLELRGTSMGSPREFAAMLALVERHALQPVVSAVFGFQDVPKAFDVLRDSTQFGKVVVAVAVDAKRAKL